MKYLETCSTDPYYNLAFEEYVLKHLRDDDYLILWQNDNTVVMGLHQNPYEEINLESAAEFDVKIVRRITGGGTVYHDLGNLNYSYITDWRDDEDMNIRSFLKPIVEAFRGYGLSLEIKGRNDLLLDGKKISGSAQALADGRLLQHGTLLINSDLTRLSSILRVSPEKFRSKNIKSVRSRVTNIQSYVSEELKIDEVIDLLKRHWNEAQRLYTAELSEKELHEVECLANRKYRTKKWNFSRSSTFSYKNKRRFPSGEMDVNLDIKEGRILHCMINGDFMSLRPAEEIENALVGTEYEKEKIWEFFKKQPLNLYFGSITPEEAAECFFEGKSDGR